MDKFERHALVQARAALRDSEKQLRARSEMNAAIHCADELMLPPLHAKVTSAIESIDSVLSGD